MQDRRAPLEWIPHGAYKFHVVAISFLGNISGKEDGGICEICKNSRHDSHPGTT